MSRETRLELAGVPDFFEVWEVPECPSTNTVLKERASSAPEGFTLIARRQSAGRGRLGRSFYSPDATGLYMSVLLRPGLSPRDASLLTPAAAVAAARAVDGCFGVRSRIKWVNDLYLRDRKICGILAESAPESETSLRWAVLGFGVNLAPPEGGFPESAGAAGAVLEKAAPGDRERLAAAILREFYALYTALPETPFLAEYRERDLLRGREITVLGPDGPLQGRALDVDPDFALRVRLQDGRVTRLAAGEVSVRGWM